MESEQESNSTETNLDPDDEQEQEQDNHHYDDHSTALKEIVEEGVDARNVLSWRVPNEPSHSPQGKLFTSTNSEKRKKKKLRNSFNLGDNVSNVSGSNVMGNNSNSSSRVHRMNALMYETGSDTQSEDSRSHFQSRLWRFLFSNITRAVDELYNLCEDENNREYCMEGIKMFDNCKNDFHKLIERMEDQKRFEEGGQVGGVSWEVRKSSSGKRRVLSSGNAVSGGSGRHSSTQTLGSSLTVVTDSPGGSSQSSTEVFCTPPPSSPLQLPESQSNPRSRSVLCSASLETTMTTTSSSTATTVSTHQLNEKAAGVEKSSHIQRVSDSISTSNVASKDASARPKSDKGSHGVVLPSDHSTVSKLRPTAAPFQPLIIAPGLPPSLTVPSASMERVCNENGIKEKNDIQNAHPGLGSTRVKDEESHEGTGVNNLKDGKCDSIATYSLASPKVTATTASRDTDKRDDTLPDCSESIPSKLLSTESQSNMKSLPAVSHNTVVNRYVTPPPGLHDIVGELNVGVSSIDDPFDREVEIETEKVWAQAEAWLEAEMKAEEDAWLLISSGSTNASDNLFNTKSQETVYADMDDHSSVFDLSTDDEDKFAQKSSVLTISSPFALSVDTSTDYDDDGPESSDQRIALNVPPLHPASDRSGGLQGTFRHHNANGNCSPSSNTSSLTCTDDYSLDDQSLSPHKSGGTRTLHEKLSSPERYKRNRMTPEQARQRSEERQVVAEHNRDKTVEEKKLRAQVASSRIKAREFREAQRIAQGKESYAEKLKEAGKRHNEHIKTIRGKAGNENAKVSEIVFINSLTQQNFDDELQKKLVDTEARIMAGRRRREEHLDNITVQQRKRNSKKSQQMSENKLHLEKLKMERWEKLQARLEAVRRRREERLAELKRRSALEMQAKRENALVAPTKRMSKGKAKIVGSGIREENGQDYEPQSERDIVSVAKPTESYNLNFKCPEVDDMKMLESLIAENNKKTGKKKAEEFSEKSEGLGGDQGRHGSSASTRPTFLLKTDVDCNVDCDAEALMLSVLTQFQLKSNHSVALAHRNEFIKLVTDEQVAANAVRGQSGKKKKNKAKKLKKIEDDDNIEIIRSFSDSNSVQQIPTLNTSVSDASDISGAVDDDAIVSLPEAVTLLRQTVQKIHSKSSGSKSKKNKKKKSVEASPHDSAPVPHSLPAFDFENILKTLQIFLPQSKIDVSRRTVDLREIFFAHGGVELCCELLNPVSGLLSNARSLDFANRMQYDVLSCVFSILQGAMFHSASEQPDLVGVAIDDNRLRSDSLLSLTSHDSQHVDKVSVEPLLDHDTCKHVFKSGLALHLVDTLHVFLISLSISLERTLLPAAQPPTNRGGQGHNTSSSTKSTPRKGDGNKFISNKSKSGSTRRSDHISGDKTGPIQWPDFLYSLIFPLFSVYGHMCQYVKETCLGAQALESVGVNITCQYDDLLLRWLLCLSSSSLQETTSTLFRQLQCVAGQCAVDKGLFELLGAICKSFTAILTTVRTLRLKIEDPGVSGITHDLSALCVTDISPSSTGTTSRQLVFTLNRDISKELADQELSSHLVSLLGALLLQDASRMSSRGRREESTPVTTPTRSFGSPQPHGNSENRTKTSLPSPILVICHELLVTLNSFCCFDLTAAQLLPQDLKASSALLAERLLLAVFPMIDLAKRPQRRPDTPPLPQSIRGKGTQSKGKNDETNSFPSTLQKLTVSHLEDIVNQLLIYLGYLSLNCPENQSFAATGPPPTLLVRLCTFPILYFSDERLKQQLLPTLICCCYQNDHNLSTIRQEMSTNILSELIGKAMGEMDRVRSSTDRSVANKVDNASMKFLRDFSMRFPVELWKSAFEYFRVKKK